MKKELKSLNKEQLPIKDLAIIGAGPVGLFTIFQGGMLGMNSVIIDALPHIGGQCSALYPQKPIYDIPGFPMILGQDLIDNLMEQCSPFSPQIILNTNIENLIKDKNENFRLELSNGSYVISKAVIIAAGCGAFGVNKPPLNNIESYENKSVFYSVTDKSKFIDKQIVIAGGGDSALDWALELASIAQKIFIVHRRLNFRGMEHTLNHLKSLELKGKVEFVIPYQLNNLIGDDGMLNGVEVKNLDDQLKILPADYLLSFYGMKMDLGPIKKWGIELESNHIVVKPHTMQTNIEGLYAVGDVANYNGKLKLILSGFAESAIACNSAYKQVFPGKALHFQYSTTQGVPSHD